MLQLGEVDYAVSLNRRDDTRVARLVPRITISAHDGHWHEATVEAVTADGKHVRRTCADGPRTLMFHDKATAVALFAQRVSTAGVPASVGREVASAAFGAARGDAIGVREWLDALLQPRWGPRDGSGSSGRVSPYRWHAPRVAT
jgi:hypothetical protein